ncbi:MAG: LemA family protein [bacterium]|nr:LemA family protein [bacterium]
MWWIVLIVVGALILLGVIWYIACANNFVRLKNNIDEAFSTMDVYLKKRFDLIPNIVETVKGYAKHEKETFEEITKARASVGSAKTANDKVKAENAMSKAITSLFAIAENYPELKANTNFLDLQNQLKVIESEIANSRKYYNACVKAYNIKIDIFPSSIVARNKHLEKATMFEVTDAKERNNVKVQF